jgi:hypothetical protein
LVHAVATVERALSLAADGMSTSAIAREIGVARATVRDWRGGHVPRAVSKGPFEPWSEPGFAEAAYCHLLGLYLGDGCISAAPRTTTLRIFFDAAYPHLIAEAVRDLRTIRTGATVHVFRRVPTQCVIVASQWTRWPELFPQDGPGRKHERPIVLSEWQAALTARHPRSLVRGLLNSDGCRFVNRVRVRGREYAYPSYQFTNVSEDIKQILCEHLDMLGIAWRRASAISRREAVAQLVEFVGPKR